MDRDRLKQLIHKTCPELPNDVRNMAASGNFLRQRTADLLSDSALPFPLLAAIEMAHAASLLHDDVLDNELIRRGNQSINRTRGNKASILYGDILLAAATRLTAENGDPDLLTRFMQSIQDTCRGELEQQRFTMDNYPTEEEYFSNTRAKTGSFFGYAAFIGTTFPTHKSSREVYADIFTDLGACYQLLDDLKDSKTTGKQRTDRENETISFPVVLLNAEDRIETLHSEDTGPLSAAIDTGMGWLSTRYAGLREQLLELQCKKEILEITDGLFQ